MLKEGNKDGKLNDGKLKDMLKEDNTMCSQGNAKTLFATVVLFQVMIGLYLYTTNVLSFRLFSYNSSHVTNEDILPRDGKQKVILAVGVLSRLSDIERRISIRSTWFNMCNANTDNVICKMFTDSYNKTDMNNSIYVDEGKNNSDLVYMPFKGINFGLRLIWMFQHLTQHYEFDFFLRVDDDYFVCIDRLLKELNHKLKSQTKSNTSLYWGWVHCYPRIVRVDEGFMILTYDLIDEALQKLNTTLMCSGYGDQSTPLWMLDSKYNVTYVYDNNRIVHLAEGYEKHVYVQHDLCDRYLAIHRSYPKYMRKYWNVVKGKYNKTTTYHIPQIGVFEKICPLSKEFDYRTFGPPYHSTPRLCKDFPVWNGGSFAGRGGT